MTDDAATPAEAEEQPGTDEPGADTTAADLEQTADAEPEGDSEAEVEAEADPNADLDGKTRKELNAIAKDLGIAKADKIKGGVPAVVEAIKAKRANPAATPAEEPTPARVRAADDPSGFWGGPHAWFRTSPGSPVVLVARDVDEKDKTLADRVHAELGDGKTWVGSLADEPDADVVDPGVRSVVFEHGRPLPPAA